MNTEPHKFETPVFHNENGEVITLAKLIDKVLEETSELDKN